MHVAGYIIASWKQFIYLKICMIYSSCSGLVVKSLSCETGCPGFKPGAGHRYWLVIFLAWWQARNLGSGKEYHLHWDDSNPDQWASHDSTLACPHKEEPGSCVSMWSWEADDNWWSVTTSKNSSYFGNSLPSHGWVFGEQPNSVNPEYKRGMKVWWVNQ